MSEVKTDSVVNVSGDNDSGIDLSTNDVVAIKTADSERVRVDASGNVGIGTNSPDKLFHLATTDTAEDMIKMSNGTQDFRFGVNNSSAPYLFTYSNHGMRFGTNSSERMQITSSGEALIGTDSGGSSNRLHVKGPKTVACVTNTDANGGTYQTTILFRNSSDSSVGSIDTNSTTVRYQTSSDHRLKENVVDMTGAIDRVKTLAPKRFNFIADADTTVDGFLAHEAQAVVPEAVSGTHNEVDDDGNAVMQGIDQAKLVPLLTGALKEAIAKIEALEARVTALEDA